MGSISDWFPSRKSVLIQMGGCVIRLVGQVRSEKSRSKGLNGMYLVAGFDSMMVLFRPTVRYRNVLNRVGVLRGGGWLPDCHGALGPATDR